MNLFIVSLANLDWLLIEKGNVKLSPKITESKILEQTSAKIGIKAYGAENSIIFWGQKSMEID